jgi:hypothetical protein
MTITDFIIKLVDKLSWPLCVIILVLILRREISGLIEKLRSMKYKDLSLEFDKKLEDVREKAKRDNITDIFEGLTKDKIEYYEELCQLSPIASILESWLQVETVAERILREHGEKYHRKALNPLLVKMIPIIGMAEWERFLYDTLRKIRNEVVHQENAQISREIAMEYTKLALGLASRIERKFNNLLTQ